MKIKLFFFLVFIMTVSVMMSCRSRMSPAQKKAYKMEKQMKKENEKMVAEYLEHHYNIQPVETQQMMKSSKKR